MNHFYALLVALLFGLAFQVPISEAQASSLSQSDQSIVLGQAEELEERFEQLSAQPDSLWEIQLSDGTALFIHFLPKGKEGFFGKVKGHDASIFAVRQVGNGLEGELLVNELDLAFSLTTDEQGTVRLSKKQIGDLICVPEENEHEHAESEEIDGGAMAVPAGVDVDNLQSLADSPFVIYIDTDGETVSGDWWNSYYNSGNDIVCASSGLTDDEIYTVWKIMSEDFRPFNVNVTTRRDLYEAVSQDKSVMLIVTTTRGWQSVSTTGIGRFWSFKNNDSPCFSFPNGFSSNVAYKLGEVSSHEVGHALGLHHDGNSSTNYYSGHGNWAPIMGSGYYKNVTQWDKAEYSGSNNTAENDLQIITQQSLVPYRTDDHGNATAQATELVGDVNSDLVADDNQGVIERSSDVDYFSFTTGGGLLSLDFNGADPKPNLDISVKLYDEFGSMLASSDVANQVYANLDITLNAGTYYIAIEGVGYGNPANTGYSDYASLGWYGISGNIENLGQLNSYTYNVSASNLQAQQAGCGDPMVASFDLINRGTKTLTSVTVELLVNGSVVNSFAHSTNLASYSKETVNLNAVNLSTAGNKNVEIRLSKPNGVSDEDVSNNETATSLFYSLGDLHQFVIANRSENSSMAFEITENGNVVANKSDATVSTSGANSVYGFCLAEGCYDLKVTDAFKPAGCSEPAWSSSTTYQGDVNLGTGNGEVVSYGGKKWRAKWWSQNHTPGTNDVWLEVGECNLTYDTDTYKLLDNDANILIENTVANYVSPRTDAFCSGSQTTVTADFSANETSVYSCSDVVFTANTSGTVTSYAWDFGADAKPSTATGIGPHTVSYGTTGAKTVSLTVNGNVTETKTNYVTVSQDPYRYPFVKVDYDAVEICNGESIEATVYNYQYEGSNPQFQWQVNGNVVATNNAQTYTYTNLDDGDQLSVTMVSDELCLINQEVNSGDRAVQVKASVTPQISISSSKSTICEGEEITYSATATSGTIVWEVNFTAEGTGQDFSRSNLENGDIVLAVLTSDEECASMATAISNEEQVLANKPLNPSVAIEIDNGDGFPVCPNSPMSFRAVAQDEGNSPSYFWKVDDVVVGQGMSYTTSSLKDGQILQCEMTVSESCVVESSVESTVVMAEILDANDSQCSITSADKALFENLVLYPNPTEGVLNIEGLEEGTQLSLFNPQGILVKNGLGAQVEMHDLPAGTYFLKIEKGEKVVFKSVVKQ